MISMLKFFFFSFKWLLLPLTTINFNQNVERFKSEGVSTEVKIGKYVQSWCVSAIDSAIYFGNRFSNISHPMFYRLSFIWASN